MAKEPDKNDLLEPENAAAAEGSDAKKKKAAKPKKSGELPIVLMVGGALGGVILIVLSVIIGTVLANKLFPPNPAAAENSQETEQVHEEDSHKAKPLKDFPEDGDEFSASNLLSADSDWQTLKSDKITTNVKGSTNMYVVAMLTIDYKLYYVEELKAKGFATEAGQDSHGNPTPPGVDTASALYQKLKLNVTSKISEFMGSHTEAELQAMRSELGAKFKEDLKQTFKDFGLIIGNVNVVQFIFAKQ